MDYHCNTIVILLSEKFMLVSVFNLERAIAPLTPFKGNWRKFDVYWGRNGATNHMRFENMQQFQLKNVKIAMKHRGEKRKFTVFTWFPFHLTRK